MIDAVGLGMLVAAIRKGELDIGSALSLARSIVPPPTEITGAEDVAAYNLHQLFLALSCLLESGEKPERSKTFH